MNPSLLHDVIEDGFDRHNIAVIQKRFLDVNEDRLERMRGALPDRAQLFMDVLPLLFHTNHPMMPGFVSHDTPAGISHFKPTKRDLIVGKSLAKSFKLPNAAEQGGDVHGIYIMGSVGTIGQSGGSDLDIWICYRPDMKKQEKSALERKCEKISRWAQELRLEVHFFLMDETAFRTKKFLSLNKESSGSTQQLLLLDEFYRTAIYIAGRMPLWWFVPTNSENVFKEYANTLLYKRFLPVNSVVNFGGISDIPAGEFLGAGIWQLYKAIESPYKSVLKLLLLEAYVASFPKIEPLSLTFKSMIYQGEYDIDKLDSYVMIYHRIEKHLLEQGQTERLELARKCFYFKTNKLISRPPSKRAKSWQRLLIEEMTARWGWTREYIRHLDSHASWKAASVQEENSTLVTELNRCYRFLVDFAGSEGKSTTASADELVVLGRKLQAAFERRPGKIDIINTGISKDLSESVIVIASSKSKNTGDHLWTAFSHEAGIKISEHGNALKSSENIIELLFWCYANAIVNRDTRIELAQSSQVNKLELRRLLDTFSEWHPLPMKPVEHARFQKTAAPTSMLVLVNAGRSPTPDLDIKGYQRLSNKADVLTYGENGENLVVSVDTLVKNTWNELSVRRYEGDKALIEAILDYLQLAIPGSHQKPPEIKLVCIGRAHVNSISQRVEKLLRDITTCFFEGKQSKYNRFIFQVGSLFHCIKFKGMKPLIESFKSQLLLVEHLEEAQKRFSKIVLDTHAFRGHILHIIALTSRPKSIDVYFRRFDIGTEVYVSDERGSIVHMAYRGRKDYDLFKPLYRFLRAVVYRQANIDPELTDEFGILPINFFEIVKAEDGRLIPKARKISTSVSASRLDLRATAHIDEDNTIRYDFNCDGQDFTAKSFDKQIELVVSQYILSRRANAEHYPVYISDLDLKLAADAITEQHDLQTMHYLKVRNRLESRLNKAIGILLDA